MAWNPEKVWSPDLSLSNRLAKRISHEPLLTGAIILCLLLMGYQLTMLVLKPAWLSPATDWGRVSLAWLELIPVLAVGVKLYRSRQTDALAWLLFAATMFCYTLGETTWLVLNDFVELNTTPVPSLADLFYLLQYPFFFLGLTVLPRVARPGQPAIIRVKVVLDSLLLMIAGTAVAWYFILAPYYTLGHEGFWGKAINLAYPVGDLGILFALLVIVIRQKGLNDDGRMALYLLIAAHVFLTFADLGFLYEQLYTSYVPGTFPDVFWMACYLLFGLAGLVRWRAVKGKIIRQDTSNIAEEQHHTSLQIPLVGNRGFRSLIPFLAAILASLLIIFRAITAPTAAIGDKNPIIPFIVSLGLLVLVGARQGITMLENEQLLRDEQQRGKELSHMNQLAWEQRILLDERNQRLQDQAKQVESAYEQQLQLNELKDQFLLNVNHELRTPLTEIYGYLELLGKYNQQVDATLYATFLDHALRGCEELQHLVNNVLNAIQGDFLGRSPQLADLLVAPIVQRVLDIFDPQKRQQYDITLDISESLTARADRQYLHQVLLNLISNAFKYSPPHTAVVVRAELGEATNPTSSPTAATSSEVCICVQDAGPGIPPSDFPLLFGKFVRLQRDLIGSVRGSGLGLYISKQFVEAMGGHIWVESTGIPGQGSCFCFTLPAAPPT